MLLNLDLRMAGQASKNALTLMIVFLFLIAIVISVFSTSILEKIKGNTSVSSTTNTIDSVLETTLDTTKPTIDSE